MSERTLFEALDGYPLAGHFFEAESARGCALIAPAMAVRQRFYAQFAAHVARLGLHTLTLDYRGIGESRIGPLHGLHARFRDWGERDLAGAIRYLRDRYPKLDILYIGHSAGGQLMGLLPDLPERALFIASGNAAHHHYRGLSRAAMALFHWVAAPVAVRLRGHLPMRAFRQGEDIPRGVALEWAEWGRDPRYVRKYADMHGGLGFDRYAGPLTSISFADDRYAPPGSVQALLDLYPRAQKELLVHPGPCGHFGFFQNEALWSFARNI